MNGECEHERQLIDKWIRTDPYKPGPADVRIADTGIHVWALIGYLPAVGNNVEQVARDYDLPVEAVRAAVAYHREHRDVIDGRLEANSARVR